MKNGTADYRENFSQNYLIRPVLYGTNFGLYRDLEFRILSTLGALKNHLRRLETSYIQNNRTRNDTPDTIPRNLVVSPGFGNARKSNFLKVKDVFQNFNNLTRRDSGIKGFLQVQN